MAVASFLNQSIIAINHRHRQSNRLFLPQASHAFRCILQLLTVLLSKLKQNAVIQYILDLDKRGFPPRIAGVENMANLLFDKRGGGCVG